MGHTAGTRRSPLTSGWRPWLLSASLLLCVGRGVSPRALEEGPVPPTRSRRHCSGSQGQMPALSLDTSPALGHTTRSPELPGARR